MKPEGTTGQFGAYRGEQIRGVAAFWPVLLPVAVGLVLRLLALSSLRDTPYFDFLLWDERIYHQWATKIAEGTFSSQTVYEFSPLPAYLMAAIYRLFSPEVLYVRYMNIFFGTGTCAVVYAIGKRVGGGGAGLLAGLLAAVYEPFVFYSIVPLKTTLSVFFFSLTVLFLLWAMGKRRWDALILLGASCGLLLNVRPNALALIPAVPLILLWTYRNQHRAGRKAAAGIGILFIGFAVAVSPFVVRNIIVAQRSALTTSQAGFNLYLGNHLHSKTPYYRPVPFARTSPFVQGVQFTIEASRRAQQRFSPGEASRFWTRQVFAVAAGQPEAFFRKLLGKALVPFNRFEAGDHYDIGFIRRESGFLKVPLPGFALVFPLGVAGLLLAAGRRSTKAISLLILVFLYGATLVLFFTNARYRLPLLAVLIPYAAAGLLDAWRKAGEAKWRPAILFGVLCLLLAGLEWLPVRGTDDMTAYHNTHAIVLNAQGRRQEAIRYWEESSRTEGGFSDFANLSLAGASLSAAKPWEARQWLRKIRPGSYAEAQKLELEGDLALLERRPDSAVALYRSALSINAGQLRPRYMRIQIFEQYRPDRVAEEQKKLRFIQGFYREAHGKQ